MSKREHGNDDSDTFHTTMTISNEDDWLRHVDDVKTANEGKTIEELLDDIYDFDFQFDFI